MSDFSKIPSLFKRHPEILWIGVFALLCFFVLFHKLGGAALLEPDEGRNAEVAREILVLEDWVTPHYDFIPYLDKPMSFYWLVAGAYGLFGVSEFSARLPSALAALGCVLLVYGLARASAGVSAGLWSGLVLLTSPAFIAFSRATIFDMALTFFMTLALWAFHRGKNSGGKAKSVFFLVMYGSMGCATLVKGPVGLVIPAVVIAFDLLLTRRWSLLGETKPAPGLAVFLLVVAPWYLWVELRNPGYLRYFLLEENLLRYLTPHFNRGQPWHYYAQVLAIGFFPWTALIYLPFTAAGPRGERTSFLLLWIALPLLFFSFSVAKQPGYILPIFPPLAILIGEAIALRLQAPSAKARWPLLIPWLILLAAFCYFTVALFLPGLLPAHLNARAPEALPFIRQMSWPLVPVLLFLVLACAGASLWAKSGPYFLIACAFFLGFHNFALGVLGDISETRSSRQLAEQTLPLIRPGDQLVIYNDYLSSLPFYLRVEDPIWVVLSERRSAVMGSVYMAEKKPPPSRGAGDVVLSFDKFSELWDHAPSRLLVFVEEKRLTQFNRQVRVPTQRLLTVGDVALITNQ
jgi:dolichyl-phosphate-mannose-protein mannosyltransferase